jgi:hypothetical protein
VNIRARAKVLKVVRCLVLVGVAAIALTLQSSAAFASGGLSSIVLSKALPGFVQTTPGADNGPLTQSSVATVFASGTAAQRSAISEMLSSNQISGYVRVWHSEPLTGDGLVEFAFQSPSATELSLLLGGFQKGAESSVTENHGHTFDVTGVADAQGYDVTFASNDPPVREFIVAFAKGDSAFLLTLVSTKYDLTEADAISLAQRQAAVTPGAAIAPQSLPSIGEDLFWGVLVGLLVALIGMLFVQQRTRRSVRDNPAMDVTRYAVYKHLAKDQRKFVRKAMVQSNVFDEDHLNNAAVAWANRQLAIYWIVLAFFVALDTTVLIVSKGHEFLVSILAIAMLIGAIRLTNSKRRFVERRAAREVPVAAMTVPPVYPPTNPPTFPPADTP